MFTQKVQQEHNQNYIKHKGKYMHFKQQQRSFVQRSGSLWKELRNQTAGRAPPVMADADLKA